ncbi:histidine phosphatase family protein [Jiella sp. MQZ9-1]|uniref:Histidine phosphatase family protein n=1 Tax=Jiella flava TaxID=2816857 RepID=A0A939FVR9_9HYPH|nr:histidine phosphatase family protein [Jiella flava]MBO0662858.1 histidine phosphatase family protein [Jiella flava]MCD2471382.1 histidine phosphatase family protein [Jiella flava]
MTLTPLSGLPELFISRHGQTDWNAEGRLQGQVEVPLNSLGRSQARRNGRYLRNVIGLRAGEFAFLASPLGRARETMRIIRDEIGLDPEGFQTDPRLVELNFGSWGGSTMDEIAGFDADGIKRRKADKWGFVAPGDGGESYAMLAERARPVFEALDRPTILVAHGGITRSFLALYAGVDGQEAVRAEIAHDRLLHVADGDTHWV